MQSQPKQVFFDNIWPLCVQAGSRTGVHPEIIFAQAALETGYGEHAPQNNYFGIKGPGSILWTREYIAGVAKAVNCGFAGYASMGASVDGYCRFILGNKRYRAFRSPGTIAAQLAQLQASGYATDPHYATKLAPIIDELPALEKAHHSFMGTLARAVQEPILTLPSPVQQKDNNVSDLSVFLKQHASVLNVAATVISGLVDVAPIPAEAKTIVGDVVSALQQHATNAATVAAGIEAAPAAPAEPSAPPTVATAVQSIEGTALAAALAEAKALLPEVIGDFANASSLSAGAASALVDLENAGVQLVGQVASAVATEAGQVQPIAKSPTGN